MTSLQTNWVLAVIINDVIGANMRPTLPTNASRCIERLLENYTKTADGQTTPEAERIAKRYRYHKPLTVLVNAQYIEEVKTGCEQTGHMFLPCF